VKGRKNAGLFVSCEQNGGHNKRQKTANNKTSVIVAKFKYLGTKVTFQNRIYEKCMNKLNSSNACYWLELGCFVLLFFYKYTGFVI